MFRSLTHIYAQVIDDVARTTLVAASDIEADAEAGQGQEEARSRDAVGGIVAQRAKEEGVTQVVFDRGGYPFHGRVKALAEAAREAGLEF